MYRLSRRAEIAARLQGLDVGSQVLWLTRDYHSAKGRLKLNSVRPETLTG